MDQVVSLSAAEREELELQLSGRTEEVGALVEALLTPSLAAPTALDRRRLGLPPESYEDLVDPLGEALLRALWDRPGDVEEAWAAMAQTLSTMADAAREADLQGIPPATAAQVTAVVELESSDSSGGGMVAVHLEAPVPVEYAPGQTLPVLVPGAYGEASQWHDLAPALPSNRFGQLVFYVPNWWRRPEVGEYWTCGNARGERFEFPEDTEVDATGARLAGVRAAVFRGVDKRVELVVDVREPALESLAGAVDWLVLRRI